MENVEREHNHYGKPAQGIFQGCSMYAEELLIFTEDQLVVEYIESGFPNILVLLCLLMLVSHSEAIGKKILSKMNLIMTYSRTNLDQDSLGTLP